MHDSFDEIVSLKISYSDVGSPELLFELVVGLVMGGYTASGVVPSTISIFKNCIHTVLKSKIYINIY